LQTVSRYPLVRLILIFFNIGLIAAAIAMELLPEDEAKVFVIPTLVAALFIGFGQISITKKH
jgi:hypothetical protein